MALATAAADGRPSARMMLLRGADRNGFVFYTNMQSRKDDELTVNRHVALLSYWKTLLRQVRIEGTAEPVTPAEADTYSITRARVSRLGALASDHSCPPADRATLEARLAALEARYPDGNIPRPPHWSGFRVRPNRFEFWQGMPFRLRDRLAFEPAGNAWVSKRLHP